jgi:integrase
LKEFKRYYREAYKHLLGNDTDLSRWYFNTAKGSPITADIYLRRLGGFCRWAKMTPHQYAILPKRRMENLAFDFVQEMEARTNPKSGMKYAPQYVQSNLKAIVSWASWNRKKFDITITVSDANKTPTLENERVPTNDELRRVLYADTTSLRTRASIAIMAFAGCRPEVQGNYLGLDGLKLKDLPELQIEGKSATFTKVPTLVTIRAELSKARHWYPTFMLDEGCEILKQYFERRIAEGEALAPDSAVIVGTETGRRNAANLGHRDASPFVRTTKITFTIRRAMRAAGLPWRPYVFRSYYDTMQMYAEGKGLISHNYSQTFMGHSDIESVYSFKKSQLPQDLVENMREAYSRVAELLGTRKGAAVSKDEMLATFNRRFLKMSNWTDEEVDALGDLSGIEESKLQELLDKKSMQKLGLNGNSQRVVPKSEVKKFIEEGWEYMSTLPSGEAIIRLPTAKP